jgi:hypothetical protein
MCKYRRYDFAPVEICAHSLDFTQTWAESMNSWTNTKCDAISIGELDVCERIGDSPFNVEDPV